MKRILLILVGTGLLLSLVGCSDEADPQFRIRNERSDKANVQLQTSGGNTIRLFNTGGWLEETDAQGTKDFPGAEVFKYETGVGFGSVRVT